MDVAAHRAVKSVVDARRANELDPHGSWNAGTNGTKIAHVRTGDLVATEAELKPPKGRPGGMEEWRNGGMEEWMTIVT